jgi:hypothetical protein
MERLNLSLNSELLEFWRIHGEPGRIGLVHLDFPPAKLINWAESWATPDGKPSPWVHCFIFLTPRDEMPWIAESDMNIPLPGFRPKADGPQENPVTKWSFSSVDQAIVLDTGIRPDQFQPIEHVAQMLHDQGYTYSVRSVLESAMALFRHDLSYRGPLHQPGSMHCGHFLRQCLALAGLDPFGPSVAAENTIPALFPTVFPTIGEWRRNQTAATEDRSD